MLVVASVAMVDDKRTARRVRPTARVAFTTGVIASVAANIAAAHPSVGARIVAAWPALALLLVVEMLSRPGRRLAEHRDSHAAELGPEPSTRSAAELPMGLDPSLGTEDTYTPAPAVALARMSAAGTDGRRRRPGQPPLGYRIHTAEPDSHRPQELPPRQDGESVGNPHTPHSPVKVPAGAVPPAPPAPAGRPRRVPPRTELAADPNSIEASRLERSTPPHRAGTKRRPTALTRQLATQIMSAQPRLSRSEVAAQLGVSTRRLREVLSAQP
jgi:hypothetical protein